MATHKHIDKICIVIIICAALITGLFMNGERLGIQVIADEDAESYTGSELFTTNDMNGDWDTSGATTIELNETTAKISGNGAYVNDGNVYITGGGYYVISGTLTDGSIIVDAYSTSKVWILLDEADIYCSDDAALRIEQAEKVFLTLAEGTENSLTSGDTYSDTALADGTGGTIYAHDDLTINGSGSLTIVAGYKHGIDANDGLRITGGTITITASADAIHVNDSFRYANATLTIDAGDDGIHSDTDIYILSGTILIHECYEGFEAKIIEVEDGDITIYPMDDGFNANGSSEGGMQGGGMQGGGFGGMQGDGSVMNDSSSEEDGTSDMSGSSENGEQPDMSEMPDMSELPDMNGSNGQNSEDQTEASDSGDEAEEECYIRIAGGTITIINDSAQDADGLDSNGSVYITGGTIRISLVANGSNSAIDYGSESGGICEISGGTVVACGSSSMAESFDASSEQCSILYNMSISGTAGTTFAVEDMDGNILISYLVPCSYSSVNVSCPELTVGETYKIIAGDSEEEITLDSVVTTYGTSGGMGGMMGGNPGGNMRDDAQSTGEAPSGDDDQSMREPPSRDGEQGMREPPSSDGNQGMGGPPSSDGDQSMGEPLSGSGEQGVNAQPGDSFEMNQNGNDTDSSEAASDNKVSLSELGTDTWIWLALSVGSIAIAILFAKLYRRKRG